MQSMHPAHCSLSLSLSPKISKVPPLQKPQPNSAQRINTPVALPSACCCYLAVYVYCIIDLLGFGEGQGGGYCLSSGIWEKFWGVKAPMHHKVAHVASERHLVFWFVVENKQTFRHFLVPPHIPITPIRTLSNGAWGPHARVLPFMWGPGSILAARLPSTSRCGPGDSWAPTPTYRKKAD